MKDAQAPPNTAPKSPEPAVRAGGTADAPPVWSAPRLLRACLGAALVLLCVAPFYRLLESERTGLAGSATASLLDIYSATVWSGLLLLVPVALLGALLGSPGTELRVLPLLDRLRRPRLLAFAAAAALIAGTLAAVFVLVALEGKPNHVDSIVQVLHARYWAEGRLAGPAGDGAFRAIQNAVFTEHGWVSQYPPGHVLVLALFLAIGVPWAAGPMLVAVTVFFATLALNRLLPARPLLVRTAACLLALSPFLLLLGASYMNHITACAAAAVGAWALCRAWQEHARWALAAGAAFGFGFATRPVSTLAAAAALSLLTPALAERRPDAGSVGRMLLIIAVGALPFALLLMAYNAHFFGGPFTFGYSVALGPRMGLGLHLDPWGNVYGAAEVLAYTSADLTALGVHLLEAPLSAVLVVGLFLIIARRLDAGERVLVGWAMAPVAANALYWHHGLFMGPRMLHEAAPPWVFLFVIGAAHLVRRVPRDLQIGGFHPRTGAGAALAGALALGLLVLGPQRAFSYGGTFHGVTRTPVPELDRPALVFVHEGWTARVAMTLAAERYRLDLIETLLRQNSTCAVHELSDAAATGDAAREQRILAGLDTMPRAHDLPAEIRIVPGSTFRTAPNETLSPACMRQARSDASGVLTVTPLLWQGDLPGEPARGPLFVRDLGPARNAALIAQQPERQPWLYTRSEPDAAVPVLLPYDEGMARLWSPGGSR